MQKYKIGEYVTVPNGDLGIIKDYNDRSQCYRVYFEDEKYSLWLHKSTLKSVESKQYNIFDYEEVKQ